MTPIAYLGIQSGPLWKVRHRPVLNILQVPCFQRRDGNHCVNARLRLKVLDKLPQPQGGQQVNLQYLKKKLVDDHRRGPYRETVWQQDDSGQCFFNSYTLLRMTASGTDPLRQYGCSIGRASSGLSLASTITSTASASFVACRTFCIIL